MVVKASQRPTRSVQQVSDSAVTVRAVVVTQAWIRYRKLSGVGFNVIAT
jgi:hypothetical protein